MVNRRRDRSPGFCGFKIKRLNLEPCSRFRKSSHHPTGDRLDKTRMLALGKFRIAGCAMKYARRRRLSV
jgi:hypothetical protein